MTELSGSELAELAAALDLGPLEASARIESGTINSNYWIECGGRRFFVRVNEGKTAADVDYEIALIDAVRAAGVITPAVLASPAGERVLWRRQRPVMVFEWIDGEHRDEREIEPGDVGLVGAELAALHRASAGFEGRRPGIYRTADIARRFAGFRDTGDPQLAAAIGLIESELEFLADRAGARAELVRAVIHQDLFPDNVLFRPRGRPALIDFEQAADGACLYDLAVVINAWCVGAKATPEPARVSAAVAGYGGLEALHATAEALWIELRAAAVRFAVTRITDVYLAGLARAGKDFSDYTARLTRWRQLGVAGVEAML